MRRSHGKLAGRSKHIARKKKYGIPKLLQEFSMGDRVAIVIKAGFKDHPHPRFRGKTGVVVGKQGNAYVVEVPDGKKTKKVITPPIHLEKVS